MRVILEGPDGAGKTTLARKLIEWFPQLKIHHEGLPPTEDLLQYYAQLLVDNDDTVFDRLHLGELIYGPAARGRSLIDDLGYALLQRLIIALDSQVIYCLPAIDTCFRNWRIRSTEYVKSSGTFVKIYCDYVNHANRDNQTRSFIYDYENQAITSQMIVPGESYPPGIVGEVTHPAALFVAEIANHPTLDLPFFATNNSSGYFHNSLQRAGWNANRILMTNARKLKPLGAARDLREIWSTAHEPPVIAVGAEARRVLKNQRISTHDVVEHPSFWKRFHAHEQSAYVDKLRRIRESIPGATYRG